MPAKLELDVNELIRRYASGESSTKIAVAMGISENSVLNYLRAAGVPRRASGPARKYDDATICQMYKDGMDIQEIQEKTGAKTSATFYAILKRNGVPVRLQRHKLDDPAVKAEVLALRAEGLTHVQIAKKIGINRNYIGQVLSEDVDVVRTERWRENVVVRRSMSVPEMYEKGLTIDEISEVTGKSRVEVYEEVTSNQ